VGTGDASGASSLMRLATMKITDTAGDVEGRPERHIVSKCPHALVIERDLAVDGTGRVVHVAAREEVEVIHDEGRAMPDAAVEQHLQVRDTPCRPGRYEAPPRTGGGDSTGREMGCGRPLQTPDLRRGSGSGTSDPRGGRLW